MVDAYVSVSSSLVTQVQPYKSFVGMPVVVQQSAATAAHDTTPRDRQRSLTCANDSY